MKYLVAGLLGLALVSPCLAADAPQVPEPSAATQIEIYLTRLKASRDACEVDVAALLAELQKLKARTP